MTHDSLWMDAPAFEDGKHDKLKGGHQGLRKFGKAEVLRASRFDQFICDVRWTSIVYGD